MAHLTEKLLLVLSKEERAILDREASALNISRCAWVRRAIRHAAGLKPDRVSKEQVYRA